jgi:hypothetical protein
MDEVNGDREVGRWIGENNNQQYPYNAIWPTYISLWEMPNSKDIQQTRLSSSSISNDDQFTAYLFWISLTFLIGST